MCKGLPESRCPWNGVDSKGPAAGLAVAVVAVATTEIGAYPGADATVAAATAAAAAATAPAAGLTAAAAAAGCGSAQLPNAISGRDTAEVVAAATAVAAAEAAAEDPACLPAAASVHETAVGGTLTPGEGHPGAPASAHHSLSIRKVQVPAWGSQWVLKGFPSIAFELSGALGDATEGFLRRMHQFDPRILSRRRRHLNRRHVGAEKAA
jgi:hypothetical protein